MIPLPPRRKLPAFAHLLFECGVNNVAAAQALGCSYETIRLICLPFDDENRRVPGKALMARIIDWTSGDILPADFYEATPRELAA